MCDPVFFEDNFRVSNIDNWIEIMVNTHSLNYERIGTGTANITTKSITISRHSIMDNLLRVKILVTVNWLACCSLDNWGHG